MKFKCLLLIVVLFCGDLAPVLQARADDLSHEQRLLKQMIGLSGKELPQGDKEKRATAIYASYDSDTPMDGRVKRLEAALGEMKVLSPEKLSDFDIRLQNGERDMDSATSQEEQNKIFQAEVTTIAASLKGAQFSACGTYAALTAAGIAGTVGLAILWKQQQQGPVPNCTELGACNRGTIAPGAFALVLGFASLLGVVESIESCKS